jgi:hypothetical protein
MEAKDSTEDIAAKPSMDEAAPLTRTESEVFTVEAASMVEAGVMLEAAEAAVTTER